MRADGDLVACSREPEDREERNRAEVELVGDVALGLVRLQVQLRDVHQRWPRLHERDAVGIGNAERDMGHRGPALLDDHELALVISAVDRILTGAKDADLLHLLLAVLAIGQDHALGQTQLSQLLFPVAHLGTEAQDLPRGDQLPVRPTLLACSRGIHQNSDVAITDHQPGGVVGPDVEVIALKIDVEHLLANSVGDVLQANRLPRQHAGQHPLETLEVRRTNRTRKTSVVALIYLSQFLRQVASMAPAHLIGPLREVLHEHPVGLLVRPRLIRRVDRVNFGRCGTAIVLVTAIHFDALAGFGSV